MSSPSAGGRGFVQLVLRVPSANGDGVGDAVPEVVVEQAHGTLWSALVTVEIWVSTSMQ